METQIQFAIDSGEARVLFLLDKRKRPIKNRMNGRNLFGQGRAGSANLPAITQSTITG
jgi:hypothetical protein